MLYTIKCPECRIEIPIESKYLINKEQITCPNCDYKLSNETLNNLKNIDKAISENSKNLDDFISIKIEGTIKGSSIAILK
ncbi:hypothetical protein SAMN02745883_00727 [Caminicella sporogenes DSM 14501]|uniref:Uncharacterized protein n=2 Tax=Caminicella TaxID=166484 RepID=A0A1M6N015_9FIRM|nr:hypothetical protein [Caminicella sporogenes]RKD22424.1 hypothetical protein BET04_05170 [Caminicella sporogenes]SHJ88943.1 hypothetical protein SAMN02745883_00727 [Caminicella sporogenes DSM 14501]